MELENIKNYWNLRAEGFSHSNLEQLRTDAKDIWMELLKQHAPQGGTLKCLDIGCGPGFLSILLAKSGHQVYAVDYSENMLWHAASNAEEENVRICFKQMDAQKLDFEDNSFDYIVSRNLTWNLEHPEEAYREWLRVLKPGGRILNFDGNHFLHHYNETYKKYRESDFFVDPHKKEHIQGVDLSIMDRISHKLPLSKVERPSWDLSFLAGAGVDNIFCKIEREYFRSKDNEELSIIKSFYICAEK